MREPSVVAVDSNDVVKAVGTEAKEMIGRTPGSITAVRPLKDGVIADFDITASMLKHFIKKAIKSRFGKPRVVICIPSGVTEVERRAVNDAAYNAGAKDVEPVSYTHLCGIPRRSSSPSAPPRMMAAPLTAAPSICIVTISPFSS